MGHVIQKVRLESASNGKFLLVDALFGTGATDTVISGEIAKTLCLKVVGKSRVKTANGTPVVYNSHSERLIFPFEIKNY